MSKNILKCKCGIETIGSKGNINEIINKGWGYAPTFDRKIIEMCPDCYLKLKNLAQQIADLTGSKYISLSHVLRR